MGIDDLSKLFLKISSEKGNKIADEVIQSEKIDKLKEYIKNILEFISVNLQAECSRISSSSLGQICTQDIGDNLKNIIEEHIGKIIFLIEQEKKNNSNVTNIIPDLIIQLNLKIVKKEQTNKIAKDLFEMNLLHDFCFITQQLYGYEIQEIDPIFKYLTLLNIQRRLSRREIITR